MSGSRNTAEKRKITKYEGLSQFVFYPVAVETLGSWGIVSKKFIADIGCRIADIGCRIAAITGENRSTSFLFQRLSVAVQRGKAAAIQGTLPKSRKLDEIYNLFQLKYLCVL